MFLSRLDCEFNENPYASAVILQYVESCRTKCLKWTVTDFVHLSLIFSTKDIYSFNQVGNVATRLKGLYLLRCSGTNKRSFKNQERGNNRENRDHLFRSRPRLNGSWKQRWGPRPPLALNAPHQNFRRHSRSR